MQKVNRRYFCGASLLALPVMRAFAGGMDDADSAGTSDPVMDALADEFASVTEDGARRGFGAEHFRRYAAQVRIFDACLEEKGTNARINRKLDDDDYYLLDPEGAAGMTRDYWKQYGILFDESYLMQLTAIDADSYRAAKKAIKKQGGVRKIHQSIAAVFERKAEEYASKEFRSGLTFRDGFLRLPAHPGSATGGDFAKAQYEVEGMPDFNAFIGASPDCLCKAMSVEGALLSILCATVCQPCCVPAAILLALVTLMEDMGECHADRC